MGAIKNFIDKKKEILKEKRKAEENKNREESIMANLTLGLTQRESVILFRKISARYKQEKQEDYNEIKEVSSTLHNFLLEG